VGDIYLSVVIPAFNEGRRVPQTLKEIRPWLDYKALPYEVMIVDDGSSDNTPGICEGIAQGWKELRIEPRPHQGKGATVKHGALAARGDFILVMDADHPTPIDSLDLMLPLMRDYDMVVGVRAFSGEEGSSGRGRRIIGLLQQLLAHIIVFKKSVADSQCGFKLFSSNCAKKIFSRSRVKGGMYDVEIFCIAHNLNTRVYSKPVRWVNKEGSTINIVRCMIQDPFSLFYIRIMDELGRYR